MISSQAIMNHPYLFVLQERAFLVTNWKGAILSIGFLVGVFLQPIFRVCFRFFQNKYLERKRTSVFFQSLFELKLEKNLAWIIAALIWLTAVDAASMPEAINKYLNLSIKVVLILNIFSLLYLVIEAFSKVLAARAALTESTLDDQLVPFASKALKGVVILLGGLLTLQSFGINVNSVLAGLGIGGMAVAFAAQESIAALFGSIVILIDSPFKLGDYIRVSSFEGTVEHIGFRSTRIRTPEHTLLVIPNSIMAKETINNFTERQKRRILQVLGILYETEVKKVEEFMEHIRYLLSQHPMVDKENITVTLSGFGDFSLSIKVIFYILSPKYEDENRLQSEIYLEFMKIAQRLGIGFAYPTQTIYHTGLTKQNEIRS
jgi:MscS family membrane protein